MLVQASQLLHWSVRQIGDEKPLSMIKDLLIGKSNGQIMALDCDSGYLLINENVSIGQGCVLLVADVGCETDGFLKEMTDRSSFLLASHLLGLDIYDNHYQLIGVVGDLIFDCTSNKLTAIEISQGLFQDLLAGRKKLAADAILKLAAAKIVTK